ncbi:MAG: topoisomerase DNA-binding C4 zinc finger domain-containing protein, partial [Gammaproteobacteria bacterium]
SSYNIGEIKKLFSPYLCYENIVEETIEVLPEIVEIENTPAPVENERKVKVCPKCSSQLVRRVAKKGSNAGNDFLACSSFPKCRYTETINA